MKAETLTMICRLIDGKKKLIFAAPNRYAAMLAKLGEGEVLTAKFWQQRDTKHNSKLHGVLSEVADALGWETDELKEELLRKLRPDHEDPLTGLVKRKKTSEMSNDEIDALVLEIKAWTTHIMPGFIFGFDERAA
jgi:hypothetical protein